MPLRRSRGHRGRRLRLAPCALGLLLAAACATSPTGRTQILAFDESRLDEMGDEAFGEMRSRMEVVRDGARVDFVRCVARHVVDALPPDAEQDWEVAVFREPSANAFALPGGHIGVHTGMLDVTQGQDQLATVIAHEVAHVLAEHPNERMSTQALAQAGVAAAGATTGTSDAVLAALGVGAQVGVVLPYARAQETEADALGLDLMVRAGFDPRAAPALWRRMAQRDGGSPPELLSTHPSDATRIERLAEAAPEHVPAYRRARAAGRTPDCQTG
ncbi:MAG: M48 family metallopeptidase [Myxococcota bacterium]|nr:M48 family metallopeptidase [Myxococcota bacterium]